MSNVLLESSFSTLGAKLLRSSASKCSIWSKLYRYIKGDSWNFDRSPWTYDLHDYYEPLVIRKGAQLAFTELAINRVLHMVDVRKVNCLYLLPAEKPDAKDFSMDRLDTAIKESNHLKSIFNDIKNIGYKQAGSTSIYIRGARSDSQLKSIPVGFIVFDEFDEMDPNKVALAMERMSGHYEKSFIKLSTPTIPNRGIDREYLEGTQDEYYFSCPSCTKLIKLVWPDSVVITAENKNDKSINDCHYICTECKAALPDGQGKVELLKPKELGGTGQYVSAYTNKVLRSVYVSQLYSLTIKPSELVANFFDSKTKIEYAIEFYKSKLGLPFVPEGGQVTDVHIDKCIRNYASCDVVSKSHARTRTMGVDVGTYFHVVIVEWLFEGRVTRAINLNAKAKVIAAIKTESLDVVKSYFRQYSCSGAVMDANPERRTAKEFCDTFPSQARMCFYANNVKGNDLVDKDPFVSCDRTTWLDTTLGRFYSNKIDLPRDICEEFREQIKYLVRIQELDSNGHPVGKYISQRSDDHFAHALNYAEISLPITLSGGFNQPVGNFL